MALHRIATVNFAKHLNKKALFSKSPPCLHIFAARRWKTKAVIFDLGGVLIPSVDPIVAEFESKNGLTPGILPKMVIENFPNGAWSKMERGEVYVEEFTGLFVEECYKRTGKMISGEQFKRDVLCCYEDYCQRPYPQMIEALKCIRAEGIKTSLLTNNWKHASGKTLIPEADTIKYFDVVVESVSEGTHKPDQRIYQSCLERLKVEPHETVFLDDIKKNLEVAEELGIQTIHVNVMEDIGRALQELSEELGGLPLEGYVEGTVRVRPGLELDPGAVARCLEAHYFQGPVAGGVSIRQFRHGQSNPTYHVAYGGESFVLRKKPPGKLLPSAHAVEREFQVMSALGHAGVPIPPLIGLYEDNSILGTPFYIMKYVEGRIFKDPSLPGMSPEQRQEIYTAMNKVLCQIHSVDIAKAGLLDYGKHGSYVMRQVGRWGKQYRASETHEIPAMDRLMEWLPQHLPTKDTTTVVHGDFRIDNLIFDPSRAEVVAVLDWELSTLGDPIADLAYSCMPYHLPPDFPALKGFGGRDLSGTGIPSEKEYVEKYCHSRDMEPVQNWDFYMAFSFFRVAAILQGVYKRSLQGQASSASGKMVGMLAEKMANIGWSFVSQPPSPSSSSPTTTPIRGYRTWASPPQHHNQQQCRHLSSCHRQQQQAHTAHSGSLPLSVSALSPKTQQLYHNLVNFMDTYIYPNEKEIVDHHMSSERWKPHPIIDELKIKAKSAGLWNLFLPIESDQTGKYGAGLTNVEYAFLCEIMGRCTFSSEIFNCSAPDTGNMEVLVKYGSESQRRKWLGPLLAGEIRSCFAMTEPEVASSDAANIQSSIKLEGHSYVLNGRKWWISGAMHPSCQLCIFMGKTNPSAAVHQQQSMILVPMDTPGVTVVRPLTVFGFDDAPFGHAEMQFEDVNVPADNILLGPGRGFEIAQGRLGPGRIHHCMRLIGCAERALELMVHRVSSRTAFGRLLSEQGTIQADIANSRIELEQARLLTLKAAHLMDTLGNKKAVAEIAMIKVVAPGMAGRVVDRAMQAFGAAGLSADWPLASLFAWSRILRIADGPDEVHRRAVARMELKKLALSK